MQVLRGLVWPGSACDSAQLNQDAAPLTDISEKLTVYYSFLRKFYHDNGIAQGTLFSIITPLKRASDRRERENLCCVLLLIFVLLL